VKTSLSSANASLTNGRLARYTQALKFAERQVAALVELQPDFFPIYTVKGRWRHEGPLWTDWCGGFLAGMMWQFHLRTGSAEWRKRAEHYSKLLEHRQFDRNVHDLGFIFLSTYFPWYELTHDPALQEIGRASCRERV
jgi:unsaturated chondroitin disaccharide hydrolase